MSNEAKKSINQENFIFTIDRPKTIFYIVIR